MAKIKGELLNNTKKTLVAITEVRSSRRTTNARVGAMMVIRALSL